MKIVIKRIESVNRRGKTKAGKDYHIDVTNIYSDVPFSASDDENQSFGYKELGYQVGTTPSHSNFFKYGLAELKDRLPLEVDAEMGQGVDSYGNPVFCIVNITIPKKSA